MPQPPGPRKPPEKRKTEWLRVRLTPKVHAAIGAAADLAGATVSAWATDRLYKVARRELTSAPPDPKPKASGRSKR